VDGSGSSARFFDIKGAVLRGEGDILIAETGGNYIRRIATMAILASARDCTSIEIGHDSTASMYHCG